MKQGDTKKLKPKDRHKSAWWKRRDESRKAKQEAYAAEQREMVQGDPDAGARVSENV